jgi:hypothetical protein
LSPVQPEVPSSQEVPSAPETPQSDSSPDAEPAATAEVPASSEAAPAEVPAQEPSVVRQAGQSPVAVPSESAAAESASDMQDVTPSAPRIPEVTEADHVEPATVSLDPTPPKASEPSAPQDAVLPEPLAPADLTPSGLPQNDPLAAPEAVPQVTAFSFIPRNSLGSCEGQCASLCSKLAQDDSCLKTCSASFCMEAPSAPSHGYLWVLTAVLLSVACLIYWGLHNLGKKQLMPYQEELSEYYRLRD